MKRPTFLTTLSDKTPSWLVSVIRSVFLAAVLLGCIWLGGHPDKLPNGARQLLTDQDQTVGLYEEGSQKIMEKYWQEPDERAMDERALSAAAGLDAYSQYLYGPMLEEFALSSEGEYGGIGVTMNKKGEVIYITKVAEGSPAEKAGLKRGEGIVGVEGKSVKGQSMTEVGARVRGRKGTTVKITVVDKDGKAREVSVKRAVLQLPVVETKKVNKKTRLISLSTFSNGSGEKVRDEIIKAKEEGVTDFILDVRGNGGGQVDEAVSIVSAFLPANKVVVSLRGRATQNRIFRTTGKPIAPDAPLTILTDEQSASASEIVAGAMQDHKRAKVVGEHTFGKGVFQQTFSLQNGGMLKLTTGTYFTPKGRNLGKGAKQGEGLKADVKAPDEPDTAEDETVQAALKVLAKE